MSDQDEAGLPLGDASHLIDEIPAPATQVSVVPVNLTGPSKGPDGEPVTPSQLGTASAQLIQTVSGKEQVAALQRQVEPCCDCAHFRFPQMNTKDHAEVVAHVSALFATLPDWQRSTLPGRNPAEWGICEGSPSGLRICAYFINHCEYFRKGS